MLPAPTRTIDAYDPLADLSERGWKLRIVTGLGTDYAEVFLPSRKAILVSKILHDDDRDRLIAHLVAHLDLHEVHIGGPFTLEQEDEAETLAEIRLDRPILSSEPVPETRVD